VVLVGDDPASVVYVGMKARASEEVGIAARSVVLPAATPAEELHTVVAELNRDPAVDGILVQLPLPASIPEDPILEAVNPAKDVDGFHPENVGRLWLGQPTLAPATPSGVIQLLERYGVELEGRRAVVVGRSRIVGKPMAALLLEKNATVTVCHSRTRDLAAVCREADVLVTALGRPALLGPEAVKEGAVVVDVGTSRVDRRAEVERLYPGDADRLARFDDKGFTLVGDVDFTRVREKALAITPVPGGVGPLTVAMLLVNTLTASRRRQGLPEDF
jgi:methylenetetrahydrofolate dehydrogenase (NADP+)/methenyltetrahydrofolate cyclohydrolase